MLIEAVYAKWNADKFDDVPRLMEKYKDQEAEIYDHIVRKYVFNRPQKDWQPLVEAMYARFNPGKLAALDSIFAKYKDSEAALYRALCDKYLPTLTEGGEPLVFNVWDQAFDVRSEGSMSAKETQGNDEVMLVSPSQEMPLEPSPCPGIGRVSLEAPEAPGPGEAVTSTEEQKRAHKEKKEKRKKGRQAHAEVFPPLLPKPPSDIGRENMAGVRDDVDLGQQAARKTRADASLRPKAAARPQPDDTALPQVCADQLGQSKPTGAVKKRRIKENGNGSHSKENQEGHKRKKRRKVPEALMANGEEDGTGAPELQKLDSGLEQRRQQLKEKLLELKTQISSQASPASAPQDSAMDFWGRPATPWTQANLPDAKSDSYSEDENDKDGQSDAEWAENRTVVLRNKLEVQLRAKLMNSMTKG